MGHTPESIQAAHAEEVTPQTGLTAKQAFSTGIFVVAVMFFEAVCGFDSYMQPYQVHAGLTA